MKANKFQNIFVKLVKKYVKLYPEHSFKFYFDGNEVETIGTSDKVIVAKYKNTEEVIKRIFSQGSLGLGEIYCEGYLDVSDEDYKYLLLFFVRLAFNTRFLLSLSPVDIIRILRARFFTPFFSRENASENINSHYSLSDWFDDVKDSNEFYAYWLKDKNMQYTCAWWNPETKTLDEAQENKFKHYAERLGINKDSKGKTILDLGCGWGGLMFYLAGNYGLKCHGITLSTAQVSYIKDKAVERGMTDQVTVETNNVHNMSGKYDYIISVGLLESIDDYDDLFQKALVTLKDGGKALFHAMFHRDRFYKPDPFLLKYIFPGGGTPYLRGTVKVLKKYFKHVEPESLPLLSYPKTLDCWYEDFCKNEDKIRKLLKEKSKVEDVDFAIRVFKHYLMLARNGLAVSGYVGNILVYN